MDEESRDAEIKKFNSDWAVFASLQKVGLAWSQEWVSRSLFQRLTVKQIGLCLHLEKWTWTARCWAMPIDKHVLGEVHKYKEVDRSSVPYTRRAEIEDVLYKFGAKVCFQTISVTIRTQRLLR